MSYETNVKTRYFRPSIQLIEAKARESRGEPAPKGYRGNQSLPNNHGERVLHSENVNLWIRNVPKRITHHEFLGFIRNTGKVRSLVLYPPTDKHQNQAAALSFMRRDSAEKFKSDCKSGKIMMRGMMLNVKWNRNKAKGPEWSESECDTVSRVLMIEGDVEVVNQEYLNAYFRGKLDYDIDEIIEHERKEGGDETRCTIEYRFACWRGQAKLARRALRNEHPSLTVKYGKDPCE
ncbi:hypothetical protein F4821DRAFT_158509 [Hypoxylon rubiginosum]|uniref:Uncharacterized protein n=1 Tax=Hypoxylon rubiginosum TaxID=110542 RepID=A0ACC0DHC0_9PEZI|nr:hypothetical protein F4821DRAFT_158509 [Hypoxylon rubiginosum]